MAEKAKLLDPREAPEEEAVKYEVVFVGWIADVNKQPLPPKKVEAKLDLVMDELVKLATDPAIQAVGKTGQVEISVTVEADDPESAVHAGSSVIRTAAHAAGGHTGGWSVDWCEARAIRREELVEA